MTTDEIINEYATKLQEVYDNRTAGAYTFTGILSEFLWNVRNVKPMRVEYTVYIGEEGLSHQPYGTYGDLDLAIRVWDSHHVEPPQHGGIDVRHWNADGIMVVDAWVLRVHAANEGGQVYLNPNLREHRG